MKTRLLIFVLIFPILFPISDIFAPPPPDHKQAFDYAEHVLIGKILSVEILSEPYVQITANTGSTVAGVALYEIQVETYLKNPLDTKIIKVPGYYVNDEHVGNGFDLLYHVGEKVFLYIQPDSHETLVGYDLIIRSYESRSLDKIGPICAEPEMFYHKGECILYEQEPEIVIDYICDSVVLTNSDVCTRSLSLYPMIIIIAFILTVCLLVYWFTLGNRK
ncbi:MAG: hypothetical protein K5798_03780 [Nitrosopumilus sp.]|uniref:hypothetical protein n=1 Tax=Nitrosopumilus sp. TaxID=2024843 RepID=UPI00242BD30A|nr:hypothetical protein [Nitrosopumilus sp.]MCV0366372.1 hypothetical protein [Nitrosopumilus sp.]